MTKKTGNILNRFTTLPFLIDLLETGKLILLNPKTWDDHNDTDILLTYKEERKIEGLLALCFTDDRETIHHWRTFSSGESGCCIEFDKNKLLNALSKDKRIRHQKVVYPTIVQANSIELKNIPFTKRYPYICESEYRVIMELETDERFYSIDISLDSITKITLSPSLPETTFPTIKKVLELLLDGNKVTVNRSTIFKNEDWIRGFVKRSMV